MDELILMDYLKSKGLGRDMSEYEFMNKFKEFMHKEKLNRGYSSGRMHRSYEEDYPKESMFGYNRRSAYNRYNRMSEDMYNEHFDDYEATELVSEMSHFENGREVIGEKFDMNKAKEVCMKYKSSMPHGITHADVYLAINAQYHDYSELFKSWFGSNIDSKIIESAIIFWFKDTDYNKGFKLGNYFKF